MNSDLNKLHPYPFEKLATLKSGIHPPAGLEHIALSIGEPKHAAPQFVVNELSSSLNGLSFYPTTKGLPRLREAIGKWLHNRFQLNGQPDADSEILPVSGTREALFSFTQAVIDRTGSPLVMMPAPFYQIYEGAAYLAGAQCHYIPCHQNNHFLPDYDLVTDEQWQRCQLLFICSPGNPTGAVTPIATLIKLIELADRYDFIIAADECYSEIYNDETTPPPGILQACAQIGRNDYERCIAFHSLSKRSNLPGLRSGFVAGDAQILKPYLLYRTYQGAAMPIQHQQASILAWNDEQHVIENRELYRQKFAYVINLLSEVIDIQAPDAGFYLWLTTPSGLNDEQFAQQLYAEHNITVLPGSYLAREGLGENPGKNRVRMALVASLEECQQAAQRIHQFIAGLK